MSPADRSEAQWPAESVSDSVLMGEIDAGSLQAFGRLYDRYCHRAYRLAFSVCRDDGRAQDAVQEAFLSVWKTPASYRPTAVPWRPGC